MQYYFVYQDNQNDVDSGSISSGNIASSGYYFECYYQQNYDISVSNLEIFQVVYIPVISGQYTYLDNTVFPNWYSGYLESLSTSWILLEDTAVINGNASGLGAEIVLSGSVAISNGTANASGLGAEITLASSNATASGTSGATDGFATGQGASILLTSSSSTASGNANVTGNGAIVTLTGSNAIATSSAQAVGSGSNITIIGSTGVSNSTANANGSGASVTITGSSGSAAGTSGATNGNANGLCSEIILTGANCVAIGTNVGVLEDKDKGISGKKHVTYIKGKKQKEVLKLRPEEIDQQVYNLLFNEAKEVLQDANVQAFSVDVLADSVVSDVLDRFNANQVEAEKEHVLEEARLNAYLVAVEYLNRLYREDEELLLLL